MKNFHFLPELSKMVNGNFAFSIRLVGGKQPSKKTIKKICKALEVLEPVLYIIGMEDTDVPNSRKKAYDRLFPLMKELTLEIVGTKGSKFI